MNNTRRKQIDKQVNELEKIRHEIDAHAADEQTGEADPDVQKNISHWQKRIEDIKSSVEDIRSEEDSYRENMPESLQGSDKYDTSDEASSFLSDAEDSLEELYSCEIDDFNEMWHDKIDEILDNLGNAQN